MLESLKLGLEIVQILPTKKMIVSLFELLFKLLLAFLSCLKWNKWEGITRTIIDMLPHCHNVAALNLSPCAHTASEWFFFASFIGSMQLKTCNYTLFEAQLIGKAVSNQTNESKIRRQTKKNILTAFEKKPVNYCVNWILFNEKNSISFSDVGSSFYKTNISRYYTITYTLTKKSISYEMFLIRNAQKLSDKPTEIN